MFYRTPSTAIIHELLGDEVIIANLDSGVYYSIRESGVPIWQLLISGYSKNEIEELLQKTYSSDLSASLEAFIEQLLNESLLIVSSAENQQTIDLQWPPLFKSPLLEKYEEMKNLLMLDPIHEVDAQGWPCKSPEMEQSTP